MSIFQRTLIAALLASSLASSHAAEWLAQQSYQKGDKVQYQGKEYQAQWWTQGETPGQSWGAWQTVSTGQAAEWQAQRSYVAGDQVIYANMRYQARWWTQGEAPTLAGKEVWQLKGPADIPLTGMAATRSNSRLLIDADKAQYNWPGVYFDGRFTGDKVGLKFDDNLNSFDVFVDNQWVKQINAPGKATIWIEQLGAGEHQIRLAKRNESTQSSGSFFGFEASPNGKLLKPAPAKKRQIEFIGDSFTVGYGNTSGKRDCSPDEVARTTNTSQSFGVITANRYQADYQINAYSGLGMIRNFGGNLAPTNFRTYYDRALLNQADSLWENKGSWRPQVVVIGLGINDFSTPVQAGEAWTNASRKVEFKQAYHGFIDKLRQQYGKDTLFVLSATPLWQVEDFIPAVEEVIAERRAMGDSKVQYFGYGNLDYLGCDWHPSVRDHQSIAEQLSTLLEKNPPNW